MARKAWPLPEEVITIYNVNRPFTRSDRRRNRSERRWLRPVASTIAPCKRYGV